MINVPLVPCFVANKGASPANDQSISTLSVQVTFGTEVYDVGSYFASNAWTPPAGKVIFGATTVITGTFSIGTGSHLYIYKNGSSGTLVAQRFAKTLTNNMYNVVVAEDVANGSDAYSVWVQQGGTSMKVIGGVANTIFWGHWISP